MFSQLRPAFALLALITLLTGGLYPLAITGLAQTLFSSQANGSLVVQDGTVVGSSLIGQGFATDGYFWPRPSAVSYDASASSGSNLGPTSKALMTRIAEGVALRGGSMVPADAVTTSASGLDPDISPENALGQVARVAAARKLDVGQVEALVQDAVQGRLLGFLGQPRVNVLELNLALDSLAAK